MNTCLSLTGHGSQSNQKRANPTDHRKAIGGLPDQLRVDDSCYSLNPRYDHKLEKQEAHNHPAVSPLHGESTGSHHTALAQSNESR